MKKKKKDRLRKNGDQISLKKNPCMLLLQRQNKNVAEEHLSEYLGFGWVDGGKKRGERSPSMKNKHEETKNKLLLT